MEELSKSVVHSILTFVVPTAVLTLFRDGSECWKPDRLGEEEIEVKKPKMGKKEKKESLSIFMDSPPYYSQEVM